MGVREGVVVALGVGVSVWVGVFVWVVVLVGDKVDVPVCVRVGVAVRVSEGYAVGIIVLLAVHGMVWVIPGLRAQAFRKRAIRKRNKAALVDINHVKRELSLRVRSL